MSPDGYVLTALHVVRAENGETYSSIVVGLPNSTMFAKVAAYVTAESLGQDFVLLKLENVKTKLPFLQLGRVEDATPGGDATIIGFPFSALTFQDKSVSTKFCLSANFAAKDLVTVPVDGMNRTPKGQVPIHKDVKVDVIYFQGSSVKGISGSPIISRDTGRVVGIVTLKLAGISNALLQLERQTANGLGGNVSISGLEPGKAVNEIISVLDRQLANGLGAATGIDDPAHTLKETQRATGNQSLR